MVAVEGVGDGRCGVVGGVAVEGVVMGGVVWCGGVAVESVGDGRCGKWMGWWVCSASCVYACPLLSPLSCSLPVLCITFMHS